MSISLIIPVYNEQTCIAKNLAEILVAADRDRVDISQVIVVDDGSVDGSFEVLDALRASDPRLEILSFTRNFGKESAIYAGLSHCRGEAAIVMDSDLQHPPELLGPMVEAWKQGFDVVEACKSGNDGNSVLRHWLTGLFYVLFARISRMDLRGKTDFKLLDRQVIDAYCELPERKRFFRGLISWFGFATKQVWFKVPTRADGGSKWSLLTLFRLGVVALTSFSSSMLHLVSFAAAICFVVSFVFASISLIQKISGIAVSGFTTINILVLFVGSIIMFSLGQLGLYVEHLFDESKKRPLYIINRKKSSLRVTTSINNSKSSKK